MNGYSVIVQLWHKEGEKNKSGEAQDESVSTSVHKGSRHLIWQDGGWTFSGACSPRPRID